MAPHVILLPYAAQGHINPVLHFAKHLTSRGVKATLVTIPSESIKAKAGDVGIEFITSEVGPTGPVRAEGGVIRFTEEQTTRKPPSDMFREGASETLKKLIMNYAESSDPISCLVYDSICTWAVDIAKENGLLAATFFTQSCGVCSIFYRVKSGLLHLPLVEEPTTTVSDLPGLPVLTPQDLPTVLCGPPNRALYALLHQFSNVDKADWLLFNSFDKLESEVVKMMAQIWSIKTIGPVSFNKPMKDNTENGGLSLLKPSDEASSYMKWLEEKENGSVIYVSFGSVSGLEEEQMEEIAWGIGHCNKYFLWAVNENEQDKLPRNFIDHREISKRGLVVPWCSQVEVLGHRAIGCFITHGGWNSTIEALSLGVPMVALPHIWDQTTNAKFIEDVWGVGIRPKKDEKGIIRRKELEKCIVEIIDGERGKLIKNNARKLKELAEEAANLGGSSDVNINEFVASLGRT